MFKQKPNRHVLGVTISGIVSILILVGAAWLFLNRQYVADVANMWSYTPSSAIQTIEERVDFTDRGKFYFFTTRPEISGADTFNTECPRQEPNSPILGCYAMGRIFIYDITNPQLDGIEEVTSAHEMLHAVWERMSPEERERIGKLLQDVYSKTDNAKLKERMAYYQRSEPNEIVNELHSILPTEISTLNPELEAYYAKFFNDRQAIVALHKQYSDVFDGLVARADALYAELTALGQEIDSQTATYDAAVESLTADINTFNARANGGDFSSISQFNQERSALIARSDALNQMRQNLSNKIHTYNEKYEQYQLIGTEIEALNKSIDSIRDLPDAPTL